MADKMLTRDCPEHLSKPLETKTFHIVSIYPSRIQYMKFKFLPDAQVQSLQSYKLFFMTKLPGLSTPPPKETHEVQALSFSTKNP